MEKTKIIELLEGESYQDNLDSTAFEKVEGSKYLEVLLSIKNDRSREISMGISMAKKLSFVLFKSLKSKALFKKTKLKLYAAIIIPTLTYVCEVWTTKSATEILF